MSLSKSKDIEPILFGVPDIREEDIQAAVEVMKSGWLTTGEKTREFEQAFAKYKGVPFALATNSCTAALHLALKGINYQGPYIIVPDMTFCATANAVKMAGYQPIRVDCDRETGNITAKIIEDTLRRYRNPSISAVIVVHLAGYPCDMDSIMEVCNRYEVPVIEDCAHAIESTYKGKHCGTFGRYGCFSFYASKNITTAIGEGGMLISNHPEADASLRNISLHGISKNALERDNDDSFIHYDATYLGYKYNMTDVAAAFALSQFNRIEKNWWKRVEVWHNYNAGLYDNNLLERPSVPIGNLNTIHAAHLYSPRIQLDKLRITRDELATILKKKGIGVGVHYRGLHRHPYYEQGDELFPNSSWISDRTISLPLYPQLTEEQQDRVIEILREILEQYKK